MDASPLRNLSLFVDALKRKEFEVVCLVEPAALEEPDWQAGSPGEGQRIDRELNVSVFLFFRFRLVIENVDVAISNLQEVDVARYRRGLEVESEAVLLVIGNIVAGKKDRYLHGHGNGVVDEHEPL